MSTNIMSLQNVFIPYFIYSSLHAFAYLFIYLFIYGKSVFLLLV